MRNNYVVEDGKIIDHEIHFTLKTIPESVWLPAGRVLTDSDEMAFIYMIEENDALSYIVFKESQWSMLVSVIELEKNPSVIVKGQSIILTGFVEEIQSLIYNIEGNSNYGDQFVEAVEKNFAAILEKA